jgi:hypothetical protein
MRKQVDHRWHQDEPAANAHDNAQQADQEAKQDWRDRGNVELGAVEPDLERPSMNPVMRTGRAPGWRATTRTLPDGLQAFPEHQ